MTHKKHQTDTNSESNQVEMQSEDVLTPSSESHEECERKYGELVGQYSAMEGKYKRVLADYQNLERQVRQDQQRFMKVATQMFVEQMLVPFDHLLMAAKHIQDKGLGMVIGQFKQLFESQGLKEIDALGKSFDATTMEAIETREGEEGMVLEISQPGYELNGVVIRPAKVVVGKGT